MAVGFHQPNGLATSCAGGVCSVRTADLVLVGGFGRPDLGSSSRGARTRTGDLLSEPTSCNETQRAESACKSAVRIQESPVTNCNVRRQAGTRAVRAPWSTFVRASRRGRARRGSRWPAQCVPDSSSSRPFSRTRGMSRGSDRQRSVEVLGRPPAREGCVGPGAHPAPPALPSACSLSSGPPPRPTACCVKPLSSLLHSRPHFRVGALHLLRVLALEAGVLAIVP